MTKVEEKKKHWLVNGNAVKTRLKNSNWTESISLTVLNKTKLNYLSRTVNVLRLVLI